jgi:hypothetical protein
MSRDPRLSRLPPSLRRYGRATPLMSQSFGSLSANQSELREYAALLRALRTNELIDVASQDPKRTSSSLFVSVVENLSDDDVLNDEDEIDLPPKSSTPAPGLSQPITDSHTSSELAVEDNEPGPSKPRAKSKRPRVPDDDEVWTRWPLSLNELDKPVWSFSDEIERIGCRALSNSAGELSDGAGEGSGTEEANDAALDRRAATNAAALSASQYLSNVLDALSAFMPDTSGSMRARVKGMEWESVLDVVSACGLSNKT